MDAPSNALRPGLRMAFLACGFQSLAFWLLEAVFAHLLSDSPTGKLSRRDRRSGLCPRHNFAGRSRSALGVRPLVDALWAVQSPRSNVATNVNGP